MMSKKQIVDTNNTMWPEKVAAIYEQFPWLEELYSQEKVERAYVKRFDQSTLDIATKTRVVVNTFSDHNEPEVFLTLVNPLGDFSEKYLVGVRFITVRMFFFFKDDKVEYFSETIREAIRGLPKDNFFTYAVMIKHGNKHIQDSHDDSLTELTVFKPPKEGMLLLQWYKEQVSLVNSNSSQELLTV